MSYRIIITKIESIPVIKKEWEARWTDATFKSEILPALRKKMKEGDNEPEQYGYVTSEKIEDHVTQIYSQEKDAIDLSKIIQAVNDLYLPPTA